MLSLCQDEPPPDDAKPAEGAVVVDDTDAERIEQRRMWCLQQAMNFAATALVRAPAHPPMDVVRVAEEMLEFVETGVARTHRVGLTRQ